LPTNSCSYLEFKLLKSRYLLQSQIILLHLIYNLGKIISIMDILKDTFIPFSTYNTLPHISEVNQVPEVCSTDLEDLRGLLAKHKVPRGVSIRLVHKHFDVQDGEVMMFKNVVLPSLDTVQAMRPIQSTNVSNLRGIHFFVDQDGKLQAYEYSTAEVPNLSKFGEFLAEFCCMVTKRGLQRKLGLKMKCEGQLESTNWTEYELPAQRSTIMIPKGLPMPEEAQRDRPGYKVSTEWRADAKDDDNTSCDHSITICSHCSHCFHTDTLKQLCQKIIGDTDKAVDSGMYLGCHKIQPGTPIFDLVNTVVEVW
jgi:hypothetical protein